MKMIRAMWFTLFGSILRHWHSNIAAGCNASNEISGAMRRCPVIRWLHVLRSKISLHSLGVCLDIFLIIDGYFLNFGRFSYSNQLAVGKLAVICPTWAATFLGFIPVFFFRESGWEHGGLRAPTRWSQFSTAENQKKNAPNRRKETPHIKKSHENTPNGNALLDWKWFLWPDFFH